MTEGDGDSVDSWCQKPPSQAIIEAVAEAEGVSPEDVHPPTYDALHTVVDPQALDALFATRPDGAPRAGGDVSFLYCGYEVTVERDGSITLEESTDHAE
ncbi:hypothetical protein GS429_19105 [Natronorubrum sp. JWXQ-INN-674]|uniref:Halobacterial output domain-containing protein n=1 Tax=Natronorubrum halalkaliphilum TaxID=2691917 RepID=A0A6B0VS08_9EURY|nr:HalOD1 output domain-containing protein [Natronorubrum halalkaliphilum]MXV64135.1 hypothetical protein [Natronorubrum halalkaliphilum]